MAESASLVFTDPIPYGAAIRGADVEVLVTAKGDFRAELMHIDLGRLWMQRGSDSLPRIFRLEMTVNRAIVAFLADPNQASMQHSGIELSPDAIITYGPGSTPHHRTWDACRWASMSLPGDDLAAATRAIGGCELSTSAASHRARPDPTHLAHLRHLHADAQQIATTAPTAFAHPEVTRALENALVHAMATCLSDDRQAGVSTGWRHHSLIVKRFEDLLDANGDRAMYLAEICVATGTPERTLRLCCEEHLGMGPIRYLWLRRMHLARRALISADPATTTVTQIATDHGFWELGRFATSYRTLFGESPSVTLQSSRESG